MTQKLVTPSGVIVHMQRTRFTAVNISIPGEKSRSTHVPVGKVSPSLMHVATQDDAIPTSAFVLRHAQGNLGVLYACAGGGLGVLLFDLGEPQVHTWLAESESHGHMSLVLATDSEHHLVRLPVDDCLDAFKSSMTDTPASASVVRDALDAVLEQVGDERFAPVWKRHGKTDLEHCSINLVMPAITDNASGMPMH